MRVALGAHAVRAGQRGPAAGRTGHFRDFRTSRRHMPRLLTPLGMSDFAGLWTNEPWLRCLALFRLIDQENEPVDQEPPASLEWVGEAEN